MLLLKSVNLPLRFNCCIAASRSKHLLQDASRETDGSTANLDAFPAPVISEPSKPAKELKELIDQLLTLQASLSDTTLDLEEADNLVLLPREPATSKAVSAAVGGLSKLDKHGIATSTTAAMTIATLPPQESALPTDMAENPGDHKRSLQGTASMQPSVQQSFMTADAETSEKAILRQLQHNLGSSDRQDAFLDKGEAARDDASSHSGQYKAQASRPSCSPLVALPRRVSAKPAVSALPADAESHSFEVDTAGLFLNSKEREAEEVSGQVHQPAFDSLKAIVKKVGNILARASAKETPHDNAVSERSGDRGIDSGKHSDLDAQSSMHHQEEGEATPSSNSLHLKQHPLKAGRSETEVFALQSQLSTSESLIIELQSSLAKSDSSVEILMEDLASKSQEVSDLESRLAASLAVDARKALETDALQLELEASQETVASMQADLEAERQLAYNTSAAHSLALELAQQHLYGTVSQLVLRA